MAGANTLTVHDPSGRFTAAGTLQASPVDVHLTLSVWSGGPPAACGDDNILPRRDNRLHDIGRD